MVSELKCKEMSKPKEKCTICPHKSVFSDVLMGVSFFYNFTINKANGSLIKYPTSTILGYHPVATNKWNF